MVKLFHKTFIHRRLVNLYGSTEVSANLTWHQTSTNDLNVPIGMPLQNCRLYLLDSNRQPVPDGAIGMIYAAGDGLALGYTHPEELPNDFFYDSAIGERLYKTGDLGRYNYEGKIELRGRLDEQINIRGFRVELEEIEMAMGRCFEVHGAAVIHDNETSRLVGFLVGPNEFVREELKEKLPAYMIPSLLIEMDVLPTLASGKIDKVALQNYVIPKRGSKIKPENKTEKSMLKIWEDVLKVSPISTNDDFFDLGGHSLLSVLLFAEIEKWFGVYLSTATLFQAPTISQLSKFVITASPGTN